MLRQIFTKETEAKKRSKKMWRDTKELNYNLSSSGHVDTPRFWKKLWHLGLPGKINVHIWRVSSSILPTVEMLRTKQVVVISVIPNLNVLNMSVWIVALFGILPGFSGVTWDFSECQPTIAHVGMTFFMLKFPIFWWFYVTYDYFVVGVEGEKWYTVGE